MKPKQIELSKCESLTVFEEAGHIYARVNSGLKHRVSSFSETFELDREHCHDGQARIVWSDGGETFLDVAVEAIEIL